MKLVHVYSGKNMKVGSKALTSIVLMLSAFFTHAGYEYTISWQSPAGQLVDGTVLESNEIESYWIERTKDGQSFPQVWAVVPRTDEGELNGYSIVVTADTPESHRIDTWAKNQRLIGKTVIDLTPPAPPVMCQ